MPARPSPRPARRLFAAAVTAGLLALVAIGPTLAAEPRERSDVVTTAVERIRTVDLFRSSAAVTQYTSYWCVPAAAQTMLNLSMGTSDRSYATQAALYRELRAANKYHYSTKGNDVRGWSRVLSAKLPAGHGYADWAFAARGDAYAAIVDSMDRTGRPVGIVVDRGTHAWTVVGFRVRETDGVPGSRVILGFYVVGPLGSPRDPWPKAYYTVDQLSTRFTRYHEWQRSVVWEGKFVIVAPVVPFGAVSTGR
jgi:hypothetical protein